MLKNIRQNYHHSKLPELGAIVELPGLSRNMEGRAGKWIVESFNLCDNADYRFSRGIHTVNLRKLGSGTRATVSGFWCDVLHWM